MTGLHPLQGRSSRSSRRRCIRATRLLSAGKFTLFQSPGAANKTASYNNLNELTNLAGQPFTYDADGNLTSDGQRNYSWDAENHLVGITHIAKPAS